MDLRRLTCFLAVADELNFSRAAQRLHMSQPPLSQQIRLLEQEMGAQLFERSRRAVTLTPAGLLLQEKARQIVELHQQAGELCRMAAHGLAGRLRIAFTASVPSTVASVALSLSITGWGVAAGANTMNQVSNA